MESMEYNDEIFCSLFCDEKWFEVSLIIMHVAVIPDT